MTEGFDDDDWERLLDRIENRHVLPVIGPALVTVECNGEQVPLYRSLAPVLERRLGLESAPPGAAIMDVAREYISRGGRSTTLYATLSALLKQPYPVSPGLRALAGVGGFDLFISSTADNLMAQALAEHNRGFNAACQVFFFHPKGRAVAHPHDKSEKVKPNCDLPTEFDGPALYQVMGSLQSTDFAVWEEDYMEFVCGLLEQRGTLERLFHRLKASDLLLIGAPSEDWIVRFFLRAARGRRLSEEAQGSRYYLADRRRDLPEPMTFFFETATRLTRIIDGDPVAFVLELARRWQQRTRPVAIGDPLARVDEECPDGAVFISYAREDVDAVRVLARALQMEGVKFWIDRRELQYGGNYDRALEHQVRRACSFFISVISGVTENQPDRYLHKERRWAASRHMDGYVFYLKLLVGLPAGYVVSGEPAEVHKVQRARLEDVEDFARRVKRLVEIRREGGWPRD